MGGGISLISYNNSPSPLKLFQRYKILNIIKKGNFSHVYYGNDTYNLNETVVIKKISLKNSSSTSTSSSLSFSKNYQNNNNNNNNQNNNGIDQFINELNAFQRIIYHDFIVRLRCAYKYSKSCYIVLDYLSGGNLDDYLLSKGSLSEQAMVYIIGCIGSALNHIHNQGVIHRDVKPENICLDSIGRPYLTDFGISEISNSIHTLPLSKHTSGTLPYLAPEVLAPGNYHSTHADFWSLGIMAYELLYSKTPFENHCPIDYIQYVSNNYQTFWQDFEQQNLFNEQNMNKNTEQINATQQHLYTEYYSRINEEEVPRVHIPLHQSELNDSVTLSVSEECRLLISQLLDVRIPNRLGNILSFEKFSHHPCFVKYSYQNLSHSSPWYSPLYTTLRRQLSTDLNFNSTPSSTNTPYQYPSTTTNYNNQDSIDNITTENNFSALSSFLQMSSTNLPSFYYFPPIRMKQHITSVYNAVDTQPFVTSESIEQ